MEIKETLDPKTSRLKSQKNGKTYSMQIVTKRAEVAVLISDKIDFKSNIIIRMKKMIIY
jgi:hypothetical protein